MKVFTLRFIDDYFSINNNNNNNNNNDNNNNNNNLNMNTNGRGLLELFGDLTSTVITSLMKGEELNGETNEIAEENKSFGYLNNLNRVEYEYDAPLDDSEGDEMPEFFYPGMENLTMYRRHWTTTTTPSTTTTTTTTTTSTTTTTTRTSDDDVVDAYMDTDIVPLAFRTENLVRQQKEPKTTIIFPAAPEYPGNKRYRFSVDSGTVITPNMIAGGDSIHSRKYCREHCS